ncbi:RRQRL motif-containing zinc-binding protein [Micromonospora sp. NPDC049497]|uniref:RRQRL motif-containing zinc-binding protein n=1 Tax=Micromonospora sp. NPDC049497 TaxID=3364273 RepID=UPI0037A7C461
MSRIRAAYFDPDGARYGIPTFWWRGAPPGYATRRQLTAAGLRPGGQPISAQVMWRGVGGTRVAYLYRVDLAAPKRTATPAKRRAIAAALTARRTCRVCHTVRPYCIPRSLGECLACAFPEEDAA